MKRDWDFIREVLIEIESLDPTEANEIRYGPLRQCNDAVKDAQAVLLWKAKFIEGYDASSVDLGDSVIVVGLTWSGHELLDTIRSKPVWEKIKTTAKDKGIELSFEAVIALGKAALVAVIGANT